MKTQIFSQALLRRSGSRGFFPTDKAAASVDSDGYLAGYSHTPEDARLVTPVIDRHVLGSAIIPNGHIARGPAPAHSVLEARDVTLQKREQLCGVALRQAGEATQEGSQQQRPLAGMRMNAHHRMLRFVNRRGEQLEVLSQRTVIRLGRDRIVVSVAVDGPQAIDEIAELDRQ